MQELNEYPVIVKVKKLNSEARVPTMANPGDAAFDLYSIQDCILRPGEKKLVSTGLALEIPDGYEGQVRPRSGLAIQNGVTTLNTPGTIDSGYRGEIRIILINQGDENFHIERGMRVAQLAIRPVPQVQFVEVDELKDSKRGDRGFGSTGV